MAKYNFLYTPGSGKSIAIIMNMIMICLINRKSANDDDSKSWNASNFELCILEYNFIVDYIVLHPLGLSSSNGLN